MTPFRLRPTSVSGFPRRGSISIEEGFILTNDEERELTFESAKIQVMPVWKWLR